MTIPEIENRVAFNEITPAEVLMQMKRHIPKQATAATTLTSTPPWVTKAAIDIEDASGSLAMTHEGICKEYATEIIMKHFPLTQ